MFLRHGKTSLSGILCVSFALVSVMLPAGCASTQYRYVAADHQATDGGKRRGEAVYSEPLRAPGGTVRVLSLGVVDIKPKEESKSFPALHLRLAISNQREDQVWKIDAMNSFVSFPNQGQVKPVLVNSDATSIPQVQIPPGDLRTMDLYFQLPTGETSAKDLSDFDFHWQLLAGDQQVKETTHFERAALPEGASAIYPFEPYPYALGWGPVWWGGTWYPFYR